MKRSVQQSGQNKVNPDLNAIEGLMGLHYYPSLYYSLLTSCTDLNFIILKKDDLL